MRTLSYNISALAVLGIVLPNAVFAAATLPDVPDLTLDSVVRLITTIANWIFAIFLAVAVVYILFAAYLYLKGEEKEMEESKKRLIAAAIAIAIALLAKGVGMLVANLLEDADVIEEGVSEQLFDAGAGGGARSIPGFGGSGTGGTSGTGGGGSGGGTPGFGEPIRSDFPITPSGPRPA